MKKLLLLSIVFIGLSICPSSFVNAQGVGINPSGNPPDNSAGLDVNFTNKGTLITRMTTAQRDAITNPAQALQIYNLTTNCFEVWANGIWQTVWCATCPTPTQPSTISGNTSPCQGTSQVYSVTNVSGVTYTWTFPSGWTQTGGGTTNSVTATVGSGSGNIQVVPSNVYCGNGPAQTLAVTPITIPSAPTTGTHTPSQTQIVWNWNVVSGATGYKYNTVNDYGSAIDNGINTSYTQTGLTCNTAHTLFVWAYNSCGNSTASALTQTTSACFTCGGTLTITHTIGAVAPETKTVNYGTVLTTLSGASKCWITQNLGSDNQATSATDATDAAAGWYWQFNLKQGYKVGPTPSWNTTPIDENSDWLPANDPCTIELGAGWRIPTSTEWTNADTNGQVGGWDDNNEVYADVLKLHNAGYLALSNGDLGRGGYGYYRSSTQNSNTLGCILNFSGSNSEVNGNGKAHGFPLRCIKD